MQGKQEAVMEHGSQVTDTTIAEEIAKEQSDLLLWHLKERNNSEVLNMITIDPRKPNQYFPPITEEHLQAATSNLDKIMGISKSFSPEQKILGRLTELTKPEVVGQAGGRY